MEPRGLLPILNNASRIFNFDETSFLLGPKLNRVLGIKGERHCFQEQANNEKDCLTV